MNLQYIFYFALLLQCDAFILQRGSSLTKCQLSQQKIKTIKQHSKLKASSPFLSLDKFVVPSQERKFLKTIGYALILGWWLVYIVNLGLQSLNYSSSDRNIFEIVIDTLSEIGGTIKSSLSRIFSFKKSVNLDTWQPCAIKSCTPLSSTHALLSFEMSYNGPKVVDVDIGQELQISFLDKNRKPVLGTVFPVNVGSDGRFSCIIKAGPGKLGHKFEEALKGLAVSDEVAVKKGKRLLSIEAKNCDPIKKMTIIANSLGISPSLQVMQYIASEDASSVEEVDLVWVNKNRDEFVCDDIVEGLSRSTVSSQIKATRFINNFMDDTEAFETEDFASAIPPYEYGRIALICGPDAFCSLLKAVMLKNGYPANNILKLETK